MDVYATLIRVTAVNVKTGQVETYGFCDRNDPQVTTYNGQPWAPILQTLPSIGTSVFNGAFTGAGHLDVTGFTLSLVDGLGDQLTNLMWAGADIDVFVGKPGGVFKQLFTAVGVEALRKGRVALDVSISSRESMLDVNTLIRAYAGNGQLEGTSGIKGVLKPWALGYARFCKPVLLDEVRQIYQVSGYGPVEAVTDVFEGGLGITGFDGDKPIADMLGDTGPAQGKWWRNNANGIFRLGSQPLYEITCHVRGDTGGVVGGQALTTTADIIARIMSLTNTVPIKATSLQNLKSRCPQPIDEYLDEQQSVSSILTRLMLALGGYYTFDENGNMIFGQVRIVTPTFNLDGLNRTEPAVLGINQLPSSAPVWNLRVAAEQCHFVHNAGDIAAILDDIEEQIGDGLGSKVFPPSAQPPSGAKEGDQWPDTSTAPTTVRRYSAAGNWEAISNQITAAAQVPYANGTPVESLRPAQAGADVTGTNTAQFIRDQGWGATALRPALDNSYVPTGVNTIVNSNFTRGLYGWTYTGTVTPGGFGYNLTGHFGRRNVGYINIPNNTPAGNSVEVATLGAYGTNPSVNQMRQWAMPVKVGDRVAARALVSTHRGDAILYVLYFDKNGNYTGSASSSTGFSRDGAQDGENFGEMKVIDDITDPVHAYATFMLHLTTNGDPITPHLFWSEPWMGKLSPGQTVIPPYTSGPPDPLSDKTGDNTAKYFEGQGAIATQDSLALGSQYLINFGSLAGTDRVKLGINGGMVDENNAYWLTSGAVVTAQGTAQYLQNQGLLATMSSVGAGNISVPSLGAISANIGFITSRVGGSGAGYELDNNGLRVYAANNVAAIELVF